MSSVSIHDGKELIMAMATENMATKTVANQNISAEKSNAPVGQEKHDQKKAKNQHH